MAPLYKPNPKETFMTLSYLADTTRKKIPDHSSFLKGLSFGTKGDCHRESHPKLLTQYITHIPITEDSHNLSILYILIPWWPSTKLWYRIPNRLLHPRLSHMVTPWDSTQESNCYMLPEPKYYIDYIRWSQSHPTLNMIQHFNQDNFYWVSPQIS